MTNMAEIPQELDKSGRPSVKPYLDYLKQHGVATHEYVEYWGKRGYNYNYRWVIRIEGKTYTYKGGHEFNKILKKKIISLYIEMDKKSLNNKSENNVKKTTLPQRYRNYIRIINKRSMKNMQSKSSLISGL